MLALLPALGAALLWWRLPLGHTGAVHPPAAQPPVLAQTLPNAALTAFGTLAQLAPGILARQLSSVDPAGHNNDGAPGNILYKTSHGASVIFDASGPGVVEDIWVAGSLAALGNIRITVDGASPPAVDMPATLFFSGKASPFLAPLVGDAAVSSGGNYSYVPIAFQRSCVIAFTGTTAYWHVDFRRLPPGTALSPFSSSEDLAPAAAVWAKAGQDPHQIAGTHLLSGQVDLPAGGTVPLARLEGPGRIQTLQLTVPEASVPPPPVLTRSGVAFTGATSFILHLDPSNTGVSLVRRFDYALPDQTANIYVDGTLAGRFSSPGSTNGPYFWRNASVALPASLTAGRSQIRVTVTAAQPFSAFTYWAYAEVGGRAVQTDTLEMTPASEHEHAFTVQHLLWQHSVTSSYMPPALDASQTVLDDLYLEIHFDGNVAPAVDAPLGLFFGSGFGAGRVRSLMFAVHPATGTLAAYWPMPFARSATVSLVNRGETPVPAVQYRLRTRSDPGDATALAAGREGYFHATYNSASPTVPGRDYLLLSVPGTGKLVGVSLAMSTPAGMPYGLDNLQGNEEIFLDGNPTPAYLGTGTEDFFQGGWYFEHGPFTLPTHGSPLQWVGPQYAAHISAYRLFLSDAIPFYSGVRAGIQVGPTGNLSASYSSVAFWYGLPVPSLVQTDTLRPTEAADLAAHGWSATGASVAGPVTGTFQGGGARSPVTATGVAAQAVSFTVRLPAVNAGAVLTAQLDQCPGHQAAMVYVGGSAIGLWADPGGNCAHIWREASFLLPATLTSGHTALRIRLVAAPGPGATQGATPLWTAFGYRVLAFTGGG